MPAKRKTRADRLREQFSTMYRTGKALSGMKDPEIAESIGLKSVTSLKLRKEDPSRLTLGELTTLAAIMQWSDDDILKLVNI